jgi:BlaI family transcriptional regulator, penicillinase repressor
MPLMSHKSIDQMGKLQRAILETVWELGQATVHDVLAKIGKKRQLAYTTVLTAMQRLEKAGLLKHKRQGKSHVYLATNSREESGTKSIRGIIKSTFGGNTLLMLQHLMEDESIMSGEELNELRKMIDKKRKEK